MCANIFSAPNNNIMMDLNNGTNSRFALADLGATSDRG